MQTRCNLQSNFTITLVPSLVLRACLNVPVHFSSHTWMDLQSLLIAPTHVYFMLSFLGCTNLASYNFVGLAATCIIILLSKWRSRSHTPLACFTLPLCANLIYNVPGKPSV